MSSCKKCGAGYYVSGSGLTMCYQCTAGSYSLGISAGGDTSCVICIAGSYSNVPGLSSSCPSCQGGTYSSGKGMTLSSDCKQCAAAQYGTGIGMTSNATCMTCGFGQYATGLGMLSSATCTSCLPGSFQPLAAASACNACSVGQYSSGLGAPQCAVCLPGTFSNSSAAVACSPCVAGSYASMSGSSQCATCSVCTPVVAQMASTGCLAGGTSDAVVCACSAGYYGLGIGAAGCTPCPNHTTSQAGQTGSLLGCVCYKGYVCSYTKRIDLTVRVPNMTLASFASDYLSTFISAIARASNITEAQVVIRSAIAAGGRRHMPQGHIIAQFLVSGIEHIVLEELHVGPHRLSLKWEHAHKLNVRRAV